MSSINDLKKNRKRADISSVHKEVIKTIEFNDITKEYLRERIDTLILDKKVINKLNRNLDSFSVSNEISSGGDDIEPTNDDYSNFSIVNSQNNTSSKHPTIYQTPPDFSVCFTEKRSIDSSAQNESEKYIDEIYEKVKIESFKNNIFLNLQKNIKDLFDKEFDCFKVKCEELIKESTSRQNDQISNLQEQLKSKDKEIHQLLALLGTVTKSELESKNAIINKLIDQSCVSAMASVNGPLKMSERESEEPYKLETQESIIQVEESFIQVEKKSTGHENITTKTSEDKRSKKMKEKEKVENKIPQDSTLGKGQNKYNNVNKSDTAEKNVVILGDSIVKHVNGWEIAKKLPNCKVCAKSFSGAKVRCMKDYLKPSLRQNPDHVVLHVGTNDLDSDKDPELIAKSIVDLASTVKKDTCEVTISNIVVRNDKFKKKAEEVNAHLAVLCVQRNILLIDHAKTIKPQHLNKSKLHLNVKGSKILRNAFTTTISNIFQ